MSSNTPAEHSAPPSAAPNDVAAALVATVTAAAALQAQAAQNALLLQLPLDELRAWVRPARAATAAGHESHPESGPNASARAMTESGARLGEHEIFEVTALTLTTMTVRSAYLLEIGQTFPLRIATSKQQFTAIGKVSTVDTSAPPYELSLALRNLVDVTPTAAPAPTDAAR